MNELLQLPTERPELTLRQQYGLADAYAEFLAIEENRAHLSQHNNTVGPQLTSIAHIQAMWESEPNTLYMGLYDRVTGLKTSISVKPLDDETAEIGYWTRYSAIGNGYAGIAVRALSAHLLKRYDNVIAKVHEENSTSARTLSKSGFVQVGVSNEPWCEAAKVYRTQ